VLGDPEHIDRLGGRVGEADREDGVDDAGVALDHAHVVDTHRRGGVVVQDLAVAPTGAQLGVHRTGQVEVEDLVALGSRVVDDGHGHGLDRLAGGERQGAGDGRVIDPGGGREGGGGVVHRNGQGAGL